VNDELERIGSKWLWPNIKVLSQHSLGGTEENHEKPRSEWPFLGLRFEPRTS
jgi:hypothetical protein